MSGFDTIVVGNDLVSEHWLAEQFPVTVRNLRTAWKEREEHGKSTPRSDLLALAGTFGVGLARLREQAATGREDDDGLRALHAAVRAALQLPGEEATWVGERGGAELAVPAVAPGAPDGTPLLILQAHDAGTVEDLLDSEGKGRLLTPAQLGPATIEATATAVSEIFQSEEPPALVLVTAGAWLLPGHQGRRRVGDRSRFAVGRHPHAG
jgi:hypothetical protein